MFGSAATAAVATASHRRAEAGAWPGGGLASIRLAGAVLPLPAPLSSGCREPAPRRAAQAYSKAWRVASGLMPSAVRFTFSLNVIGNWAAMLLLC